MPHRQVAFNKGDWCSIQYFRAPKERINPKHKTCLKVFAKLFSKSGVTKKSGRNGGYGSGSGAGKRPQQSYLRSGGVYYPL